jgi:hypothetical protein
MSVASSATGNRGGEPLTRSVLRTLCDQNNEEHRRHQHRAAAGGMSGILVTRRAEGGQPQEPQQSGPQGEAGSTGPARAFRMIPQPFLTARADKG